MLHGITLKKISLLAVAVAFILSGCGQLAPAPYSFTTAQEKAAVITFTPGNPEVSFVSFGGKTTPEPAKGTYWSQLTFPAGKPLTITVHVKYTPESGSGAGGSILGAVVGAAVSTVKTAVQSIDKDIVFKCPSLAAGGSYTLSAERGGIMGKDALILKDRFGSRIYEQEL